MQIVVKKFGGSSVANIDRIERVADKIFDFYCHHNKQLVVVVSAMQGDTDALQSFAYKISKDPDLREMAALLATGEQVVISLLAMALIKRGAMARSYTAAQLGIFTTGIATKSRIHQINIENIYRDLADGYIVIVAGFQGVDLQHGNITTLGRGGSDTTAVALAVALGAIGCDIYTDVDGVYTADPNLVPTARKLNSISFTEMLELSWLGAKVMQIQAVEIGAQYDLPIRVLSSFLHPEQSGTVICNNVKLVADKALASIEQQQVQKFAVLKSQMQVQFTGITAHLLDKILFKAATSQVDLDLLQMVYINDSTDLLLVSLVLAAADLAKLKAICDLLGVANSQMQYVHVAKLSIIGSGLASDPLMLSTIHNCLLAGSMLPKQVVATSTKVSILIDEINLKEAVNALHKKFSGIEDLDPAVALS